MVRSEVLVSKGQVLGSTSLSPFSGTVFVAIWVNAFLLPKLGIALVK